MNIGAMAFVPAHQSYLSVFSAFASGGRGKLTSRCMVSCEDKNGDMRYLTNTEQIKKDFWLLVNDFVH